MEGTVKVRTKCG